MVTLQRAGIAERRILRNLFALFIHDLAEFEHARVDRNGLYVCDCLRHLVRHPGLRPFLIRSNGELAGFIVISRPPYFSTDKKTSGIQFLFVLNGFRRKGVGAKAVLAVLRRLPGRYFVLQLQRNKRAHMFWLTFLRRNRLPYIAKRRLMDDGDLSWEQRFTFRRRR
jgi:predicted acetyltransferase